MFICPSPQFAINEYMGAEEFGSPSRNWDICPFCGSDDVKCIVAHPWQILREGEVPDTFEVVAEGEDLEIECRTCRGWWDAPGRATIRQPGYFKEGRDEDSLAYR